jgi:hypothetical protein
MAGQLSGSADSDRGPVEIDTRIPHASRIYDYLLGGSTNFAVDRELAEQMSDAFPEGIDKTRADVRANRAFLGRVVRHLAGEVGIRQFLDIGTGIPNDGNVHGVAQQVAPDSRIVCVDYDLIVQAHARLLLKSAPEGAAVFITADLRDPEKILDQAAAALDFTKPIAIILVAVLHLIPDHDDPYGIVARLLDAMPSSSHLAISHLGSDIHPTEAAEAVQRLNTSTRETFVLRSHAEVSRFFEGLELVEPGVVPVDHWRPAEDQPPRPRHEMITIHCAVGRKP